MSSYQPGQRVRGLNFKRDIYLNGELGTIEIVVPAAIYLGPDLIPVPKLGYVVRWDAFGIETSINGRSALHAHENLHPIDEDVAKREAESVINRIKEGVLA
jgi:hypothetical protein